MNKTKAKKVNSKDFHNCKALAYRLEVGQYEIITIDNPVNAREYIYKTGIYMLTVRRFDIKKISDTQLKVWRLE